jgi:hypothetical protein
VVNQLTESSVADQIRSPGRMLTADWGEAKKDPDSRKEYLRENMKTDKQNFLRVAEMLGHAVRSAKYPDAIAACVFFGEGNTAPGGATRGAEDTFGSRLELALKTIERADSDEIARAEAQIRLDEVPTMNLTALFQAYFNQLAKQAIRNQTRPPFEDYQNFLRQITSKYLESTLALIPAAAHQDVKRLWSSDGFKDKAGLDYDLIYEFDQDDADEREREPKEAAE